MNIGGSIQIDIVHRHQHIVLGGHQIRLNVIRAKFQCETVGWKGVFGDVEGGTSMA
eukprot:CAMPEP_0201699100 /NCGR_PEP_ID=MMETSP0578-20130828/22395_1 /ASSEMBLY_ACC=CAM_ASM_000663 /TAXON_ID=267565 /ORGANISM="Skeletonema grethea, Strain CCMP 1804" /LENGTH=55 /DNA_ID=CAMNT_0048185779 /DNA_START=13 /DNA_END=180 /DNA_ORIENTATION=-